MWIKQTKYIQTIQKKERNKRPLKTKVTEDSIIPWHGIIAEVEVYAGAGGGGEEEQCIVSCITLIYCRLITTFRLAPLLSHQSCERVKSG